VILIEDDKFMNNTPLADQMRPRGLEEFQGQKHLVGEGKILRDLIKSDKIPSLLFWGPPGTGKTTLARIIANETKANFIQLSAISAGVKDVREVVERAEKDKRLGEKTILFIDEIHRFNKSQQDAFLPSVENGTIILIGATTENPSFKINNALLSRCRTFVLEALTEDDLLLILKRALKKKNKEGRGRKVRMTKQNKEYLVKLSNGDARTMLNALELAISHPLCKGGQNSKDENFGGFLSITKKAIEQALQKSNLLYDRAGDEHYNIISAFHKSMRGGDVNATLYWMNRMLAGGEDPLFIARRIIRFASEDVGLANSLALPQATAAYDACRFIGMPECGVNLAQAAVYMAKSKKSIALYEAYENVMEDIKQTGNLPVPLHIRNASTKLMGDLGYGKNYKYTPKASEKENKKQTFLPPELKDKKWIIINK
jgi:putative ATPase